MIPSRSIATLTGIFFVLTFVSSIGGLLLYGPILDHPEYVVGEGHDTRIALGAFFELILVITNIASAIVLFPLLKRQNESIALGYVASRIFESAVIVVGIVALLSVVTLRQDMAGASGADASALVIAGRSLVAIHDWTFLIGPAFCAGFGNGILLSYLIYRSRLMPRPLVMFGIVGGPLAVATATAVLFGLYEQTSGVSFLFTIPEIIWEASLGIWLIVKGFSPSPVSAAYDAERLGLDVELPTTLPLTPVAVA